MHQEVLVTRKHEPPRAQPKPGFRPEVQGLRALAVLMVVTYHIWFGRVSGGVDIFLLISAFLLTLSFVRKLEAGRALDLGRYWLHMFKRLLPAVVVVLLGILAATALFVPRSRWSEILSQTWSSLFYFQNWALAANSVDYYATDQSIASPLQHFWSLSVQGQVFILWPLLFALAAVIAKAAKIRIRRAVLLVFGSVFVASLTFSIYETYTNQVHAYFDTRTRLWEFAFGTLLVLALPYLKLPQPVRVAAGWIGLAAMLSGGFILDVQGQFPGYVALWPLVAAALIILAGQTESPFGADRLLTWKPLIRLGDMSYALYLWHWPVLIIYLIWRGREEVGPVGGTAIIGLSLVLAYLTTRFVERPLRSLAWAEKKKRRAAVVIAVCVALVATPVAAWQGGLKLEADRLAANADENNPGAAALLPGYDGNHTDDPATYLPSLTSLASEAVHWRQPCSGASKPKSDVLAEGCGESFSENRGTEKNILIVGDSHSLQWLVPLQTIGDERGWRVTTLFKGGCSFAVAGQNLRSPDCDEWNRLALEYILERDPDVVVTVGTRATSGPDAGPEEVVTGLAPALKKLTDYGIQTVAIRDNPRFNDSPIECVEANGSGNDLCNPERSDHLAPEAPFVPLKEAAPDVGLIDLSDFICKADSCPAVIGNVFVYLDTNHITKSYLESLTFAFEQQWLHATGW
ncbi:acyltransferase family protein [Arthrobacter koreensis]|uniref:acyltransferase family protein n=1 Tax=Arthrobacter koreensis TaxID=199136 RepID=UPI003AC6C2BC